MNKHEILVCDHTIREGMQYRGVVFTRAERLEILRFQEALGVDIAQVAYPPAHTTEQEMLQWLIQETEKLQFRLRIAGLGRALIRDVDQMIAAGATEIQVHTVMGNRLLENGDIDSFLQSLEAVVQHAGAAVRNACISISVLDIGRTEPEMLARCVRFLSGNLNVDMITLPDTSGIMAPNRLYEMIQAMVAITGDSRTKIGVHCHDDLGMATANTVMGAVAGASCIEVSALGIGERNGIGDLFLVGKTLKAQGYILNLDTDNLELFREYYSYIDLLIRKKAGIGLLDYNTPFFGESMQTHVAGTHSARSYGADQGNLWFLNVLCGKHLVRKFLEKNQIPYNAQLLPEIVNEIKNRSSSLGRSLTKEDILEVVDKITS